MRHILYSLIALLILAAQTATAQTRESYTIIANPGEDASKNIRLNWHTNDSTGNSYCYYTPVSDVKWKKTLRAKANQETCTVFDSVFSRTADGKDTYESARFLRNTVELKGLKPDTKYKYRIDNYPQVRYFRTAPKSTEWTAAVISDWHAYTPLPKRTAAAIAMLDTLERCNGGEFDLMLHAGDITAWGGSYSFWKDLYANRHFKNYLWAGVNGNHDNMSRGYALTTNEFFRNVNNNPLNGYDGEMGVCYHFTYGDALFIMLNNENMRKDEGLKAAQKWVREVIKGNKAKYIIVMEHYQWFFGATGASAQYDRWKELFDECGVDLAIAANSHVYTRSDALFQGKPTDGSKGTVYINTPSSDNERGVELKEWTDNRDIIQYRWSEGSNTIGAIILRAEGERLTLTLYDRNGNSLDTAIVKAKR